MKRTLAEWIARLTKGYKKATGKEPDGLDKLKIKMEAAEKVKQQNVVTEFPKDKITDPFKPRPGETGGITTVHHLRDPLKNYRHRIEPGSLLDDLSKRDPNAARTHIARMDFTDAHMKAISTGRIEDVNSRINYKKMEKLLETKLKGNETWDDLTAIRDRKFPYPPDEDFASGGIARVGMLTGGFTKAQVLIQMIKNTLKGSKDPYVKKTFPNFIKELTKNPELALDPNVWKQFTTGLPKNQRLVVHSDDSVDFFTQSEFGPHNIEKTLEFQKKHNLSRDQASKILKMEPEDRVLEMKRLETIRNRTKQASGGIAGELHLNDGGRVSFTKGGKVSSGLAHVLGV